MQYVSKHQKKIAGNPKEINKAIFLKTSSVYYRMKKILLLAAFVIYTCQSLVGQNDNIVSRPVAEIFTNFHYNLNSDSTTSGFDIKRAYLGYSYSVDEHFSGTLVVDIGNPEDLAHGSVSKRYASFREASINYEDEKLSISLGIVSTKIFAFQQRFWGKRYIAKPFQGLNGYGNVADLGVIATYTVSENFEFDLSLMNGKGHSDLQLDNSLKAQAGIIFSPLKHLYFRGYADYMRRNDVSQVTLVGFCGFKTERFYTGAELSYKSNLDLTESHNAWGFSSTSGVNIARRTEYFFRYDYSTSVIPAGELVQWNYLKDGSTMITGIQYTFNRNLKMALDYQSFYPAARTGRVSKFIFLNAIFKL